MSYRFPSFRLLLLGFAFLCACAAPGLAEAACELRVGWDEWPPYITYKEGHFHGVEYDLLTSTADTAGCKLDFQQIPWARALKMLGAGEQAPSSAAFALSSKGRRRATNPWRSMTRSTR